MKPPGGSMSVIGRTWCHMYVERNAKVFHFLSILPVSWLISIFLTPLLDLFYSLPFLSNWVKITNQ